MFSSGMRGGFSKVHRVFTNLTKEKMAAPNNAFYVLTQAHAGLPNSVLFSDQSHTVLQDIGSNSHATIDTAIADHPHQDVNTTASPTFVKTTWGTLEITDDNIFSSDALTIDAIGGVNSSAFWTFNEQISVDDIIINGNTISKNATGNFLVLRGQPTGNPAINIGVADSIVLNSSAFVQINATDLLDINADTDISKDLIFTGDGSGLPYGEIFVNDNTTVTAVSSSGFTQFLHFDTNGHSNLSTPDHTNDHITIDKAGVYMVDCCVNIKNSSGAAHVVEVVVAKNNNASIFANMRRHRTLGTGTDVGAIPLCGHLDLAVNDTIEVWITSDSASSRNVIGEDVVLMLTMVGGT